MKLTDDQLHTLRHILGINTPNDSRPYPNRNYACVSPCDPEFAELKRIGAIEEYKTSLLTEYLWYRCTNEGRLAAMRSHKKIRRTAPQRRYSVFLDLTDCMPDLTFKEFLTLPEFARTRAEA